MTRSTRWILYLALCAASACAAPDSPKAPAAAPGARTDFDRRVLPVADPSYPPSTELNAKTATPPPRFEVKAPAQAPNVVVVLLDDFGFGQSSTPLPPGHVTIRYDFSYDGGGRGKGGLGALFVNGRKVAEGRIDRTVPNVFSPDEGATVGMDDETVVTDDYEPRNNRFNGTLRQIVVEVR